MRCNPNLDRSVVAPWVDLIFGSLKHGVIVLSMLVLAFSSYPLLANPESEEDDSQPLDIRTPGGDLANFPNSAYTLPQGGFYLEASPLTYTASSTTQAQQFNAEYLLRYGLFDCWEIRLYSQGFSMQGAPNSAVGFSPLTFDTKVHLWNEVEDWYLPAAGLEVLVQTDLLGSSAFNSGVEPSFSINFDQSLFWDLELEYNIGAARFEDSQDTSKRVWQPTFAWALQRDVVEDFAVFINGYYNAANLPRVGRTSDKQVRVCPVANRPCRVEEFVYQTTTLGGNQSQHAIGAGAIWTLSDKTSLFVNLATGVNNFTPSIISFCGFAWTP
mgnify:CR=1 FL=1